jgi:hypothetical protein
MAQQHYRDFGGRRSGSPRLACLLAVGGVLGVVTFTLVYLSALSFLSG